MPMVFNCLGLFGLAQSLHSVSPFQGYTPADCFMLRARSLTLDSALPKIWLRFTIFAKLFHFVQFLLLWSFLRKLLRRPLTATNKSKTEPFWICFTHGCNAFLPPGASALILSFQIIDNLQSLHSVTPFQGYTPADCCELTCWVC